MVNKNTEEGKTGSLGSTGQLESSTGQARGVPRNLFESFSWHQDREVERLKIIAIIKPTPFLKPLPQEWLKKYHFISDGTKKVWFNEEGWVHRLDGPAIELVTGHKAWLTNGKHHREDGPAIIKSSGGREWWINGKLHREDGPAVENENGTKQWLVEGKLHRLDGPAVLRFWGGKEWWVNGQQHRLDGPAVEDADGDGEWWVKGIESSHPQLCEKAILTNLTREEFFVLCTHKDYVVRQLTVNNPSCPTEYKIIVELT